VHKYLWGVNMIILSKKRIIKLMSLITICLMVCVIQTAKTDKKTVQTVTLPVTNKVIVIDAGHGVPDERCRK
jgi:N-acetylmuramoyl-L-alanine amidase